MNLPESMSVDLAFWPASIFACPSFPLLTQQAFWQIHWAEQRRNACILLVL